MKYIMFIFLFDPVGGGVAIDHVPYPDIFSCRHTANEIRTNFEQMTRWQIVVTCLEQQPGLAG